MAELKAAERPTQHRKSAMHPWVESIVKEIIVKLDDFLKELKGNEITVLYDQIKKIEDNDYISEEIGRDVRLKLAYLLNGCNDASKKNDMLKLREQIIYLLKKAIEDKGVGERVGEQ